MARLSNVPYAPASTASELDRSSAELGQLLSRLQRSVLHSDPEREKRLRSSEYERARLASNLEYARASLTKLEQDALGIKAFARRAEVQGDLNKKREALELLVDRLEDLRKVAVDEDDSSDEEDLLAELATGSNTAAHSTPEETPSEEHTAEPPPDPAIPQPPAEPTPTTDAIPQPTASQPPTQTTQTLRARPVTSSLTPPPQSHAAARAALFASRRRAAPAQASTATAEAVLDHQRQEQEELTGSILGLAQALKASSKQFSTTLEADRDVLDRAGEGMERTGRTMEAARGRMGVLRRMTEGRGWWGRMILYAQIYALMVALLVLVFVMPKLRF